jgi:hypothetical protein
MLKSLEAHVRPTTSCRCWPLLSPSVTTFSVICFLTFTVLPHGLNKYRQILQHLVLIAHALRQNPGHDFPHNILVLVDVAKELLKSQASDRDTVGKIVTWILAKNMENQDRVLKDLSAFIQTSECSFP